MLQIKPRISKSRQQRVLSENVKKHLLVQEIQNARCWAEMKKRESAVARANESWKENYNPFPESSATRTNERHGNQRVIRKSNLGVYPEISAMMFQSKLDNSASQVPKIKMRKSNIVSSATVSRRPFRSHHQNQNQQLTELPFNTANASLTPYYHPSSEIGYTYTPKPNRNKQQCMQFPWVSRNERHVVEDTRQLSVVEMISKICDEGSSRDTFLQSQPEHENIFASYNASNTSAFVRYAPQVQHEDVFSPPVSTSIIETPQQKEFDFYTCDDNFMDFEASSEWVFGTQSPAANFSDYFRESRNERPQAGGLDLIRSAYSFSQEF